MFVKRLGVIIAALILLLVVGCSSSSNVTESKVDSNEANQTESNSDEVLELRLGHVSAIDLPYDIAARGFAKEVEEATDGKVKIEVYEAGQLGGDTEMIEQVQIGSLDFFAGSTASLTNFVPELEIMDLPFLF